MNNLLANHIDSHKTAGKVWPDSAEYAVKYACSTWPCGWEKEASMTFFDNIEQLRDWIKIQHEWAKCEDNHVAYKTYQWDLGPQYIEQLSHNPSNVPWTYEERNPSAAT